MSALIAISDNSSATHRLALVIPAYKPDFLEETLRSIAAQTCKEFTVYVGDDNSPHDLDTICKRWQGKIDLRYHRFEQNIGARDLVAQWTRCIALSHDEPWLWLFSDDDVLEPGCVAAFFDQIDGNEEDSCIYHFNVSIIDSAGELITEAPEFPPLLSPHEFAFRRFRYELLSYAPEYIFSRGAFFENGGFQSFPRAWCSDDATWIKLAGSFGIRTIAGEKVKWRYSGKNISSTHAHDSYEKIEAAIRYLEWLNTYFELIPTGQSEISSRKILLAGRWWLFSQAYEMKTYFYKTGLLKTARCLRKISGVPLAVEVVKILWQDFRLLRHWLFRRKRMQ